MKEGKGRLDLGLGVDDDASGEPESPHLGAELLGSAHLDMHRHTVCAGAREGLEELTGVGHHEMAVEEELSVAADRLDDGRPEGDVRHEVAVHHVDMQPVRPSLDRGDLVGEDAEVGRKDRGRDPDLARGEQREPLRRLDRPPPSPSGHGNAHGRSVVNQGSGERLAGLDPRPACPLAGGEPRSPLRLHDAGARATRPPSPRGRRRAGPAAGWPPGAPAATASQMMSRRSRNVVKARPTLTSRSICSPGAVQSIRRSEGVILAA